MDYEEEQKQVIERFQTESKKETRSDVLNTAIAAVLGAGLAYWAYGKVAHSVLFGALFFAVSAVGNRIASEVRLVRMKSETRELQWRIEERLDAGLETGRLGRRR